MSTARFVLGLAVLACVGAVAGALLFPGARERPADPSDVDERAEPRALGDLAARPRTTAAVAARLELRVISAPTGRALEGARVACFADPEHPSGPSRGTDEDGRVTLDRAADVTAITVSAEGYATAVLAVVPSATFTEVALRPGASARGAVFAGTPSAPRPVADVVVRAYDALVPDAPLAEARTDATGAYTLAGLPEDAGGLAVRIVVTAFDPASGHRARVRDPLRLSAAFVADVPSLLLRASGIVRGRVLAADGSAAPGARVWVVPDVPWGDGDEVGPTGASGTFTLEVPLGVACRVEAAPWWGGDDGAAGAAPPEPSVLTSRVASTASFTADASRPVVDVVVRLSPAAALAVTVVDRRGVAIRPDAIRATRAGVHVDAHPGFDPERHVDVFALGGLEAGRWTLEVVGAAFPRAVREVVAVRGSVTPVEVVVDAGVRVTGTVVDAAGAPIPDAAVEAHVGSAPTTETVVHATADARGRFDVLLVAAGAVRLWADADGYATAGRGVDVTAPAEGVVLRLERQGRAHLRLVPADAGPLPATARVTRGLLDAPDATRVHTVEVRDGVVALEDFAGDPEQVVIEVEGYAPIVREVTSRPGEDVDLGRVALSRGAEIVGVVVDASGRAIGHAHVVAAGGRIERWSDRDGRFVLAGLPDGVVDVRITAEDHEEQTVLVRPAAADLRIVLARTAVVAGIVVDPDGAPLDGERIEVAAVGEGGAMTVVAALRTDGDGSVRVVVPPGRYRVVARESGAEPRVLGDVTAERGDPRPSTWILRR